MALTTARRIRQSTRNLASRLQGVLAQAARRVVSALAPRWLEPCAHALAALRWGLALRARRRARQALALALGVSQPWCGMREVLRASLHLGALDQLVSLHERSLAGRAAATALERLGRSPDPHHELFLSARLGWPTLLRKEASRRGLSLVWLEQAPASAPHALALEWLGRVTLVDLRAVREALARGARVRLLLLLPDDAGQPQAWASPPLGVHAGQVRAERAVQEALDALACLARARPDLVDWTAPRWALRPELTRAGHAPWSRLAAWLAPHSPSAQARATSASARAARATRRS